MKYISFLIVLFSFQSIFSMEKKQIQLDAQLSMAVSNGDSDLIIDLVSKGANPNQEPANPLVFGISTNNTPLVQFLISKGANPTMKFKSGFSVIDHLLRKCPLSELNKKTASHYSVTD